MDEDVYPGTVKLARFRYPVTIFSTHFCPTMHSKLYLNLFMPLHIPYYNTFPESSYSPLFNNMQFVKIGPILVD